LHRSEEERHEYDFHIDAINRTITVLEPVNAKIAAMSNEERAVYKLKAGFGGSSKSIHQRIIKKIYGREAGLEVIQALHDTPALAVPIVLNRLRQKEEEWKRAQREWNKVWREVDARNYQRSLDHQGITFKASDKKATTTKAFVNQIESAREEQLSKRAALVDPLMARTRPKHQMEFAVEDMTVVQDLLKLTFVFLDRMNHHITNADRRRIENFIRSFVPIFFMLDTTTFNTALRANQDVVEDGGFGLEDFGIVLGESEELNAVAAAAANARNGRNGRRNGASDLRKKVLKGNAQDKSAKKARMSAGGSNPSSRFASPAIVDGAAVMSGELTDAQQRPFVVRQTENALRDGVLQRKGSFFCNATLYTLIRLIEVSAGRTFTSIVTHLPSVTQLLYARLNECKTLAAKLANGASSSSYLQTSVAADLALLDVPPADVSFAHLQRQANPAAHFYDYLLETCEKLFDNEIDQQTFEDIVRFMFGTKVLPNFIWAPSVVLTHSAQAYIMFTVDKVIGSIIKQVRVPIYVLTTKISCVIRYNRYCRTTNAWSSWTA
jgi:paired amphipathic helix protein Sin3a